MMKSFTSVAASAVVASALLTASIADAHISLAGPAFANATWEAPFSVGHGCDGMDTTKVKIVIPAGVTSVRAVDSALGRAVSEVVGGAVKSVTWEKDSSEAVTPDINFYKLSIRMKLPDAPFTTVRFLAYQECRDSQGNVKTTDWVGNGDEVAAPDGAPPPEPAPSVTLLPARVPGWNKFTVPVAVTALSIFNDAEIVWSGNAAYSVNPTYKALIGTEADTTALTTIAAGSTIWVKY